MFVSNLCSLAKGFISIAQVVFSMPCPTLTFPPLHTLHPCQADWTVKKKKVLLVPKLLLSKKAFVKKASVSYFKCVFLNHQCISIARKIIWPKKRFKHVIFGGNNRNLAVDFLLVNLHIIWYCKKKWFFCNFVKVGAFFCLGLLVPWH